LRLTAARLAASRSAELLRPADAATKGRPCGRPWRFASCTRGYRLNRSVPAGPRARCIAEVPPGGADLALGIGETARLPAEHSTDCRARRRRHGVEPEPDHEMLRGAGVVVTPQALLQAAEPAGIALRGAVPAEQRQEEVGHVAQFLHRQTQVVPGLQRQALE